MRYKARTTTTTSFTRAGNLRVSTSFKAPMMPTVRTSTVLPTAPPKRKRRKKG